MRLHKRTARLLGEWNASVRRFDAVLEKAYGGKRTTEWFEIFASEKCHDVYGANTWLRDDTTNAGTITCDFARLMREEGRTDVKEIKCLEFGSAIISNM